MAQVSEPRKFKLRRIKPSEDVIQKNLEPLKENIMKKKIAQQHYYENHNHSSPLVRDLNRRPVHQRLGRKAPFTLGTNTSAIPPKRRLRLPGKQQQNRTSRIFSAQNRLNLIRARNFESQNINAPKRIKLRRKAPQYINGLRPTSLTVEVKNNNAYINRQLHSGVRRFKQILSIELQQEIKKIQMQFQGGEIIMPIRVTPASTEVPLNKRFAELD